MNFGLFVQHILNSKFKIRDVEFFYNSWLSQALNQPSFSRAWYWKLWTWDAWLKFGDKQFHKFGKDSSWDFKNHEVQFKDKTWIHETEIAVYLILRATVVIPAHWVISIWFLWENTSAEPWFDSSLVCRHLRPLFVYSQRKRDYLYE